MCAQAGWHARPTCPCPCAEAAAGRPDQLTSGAAARAACRRQRRRPCPQRHARRAPCGAASHRTPPGAAQRGGPSRARRPYGPTTTTPLAPAPAAARRARYARFCGSDPDPIVRKLFGRVRFDFDGKRKPAVTAGTGWHLSFGDSTNFDLAYAHALPPPPTTRAGCQKWLFGSASGLTWNLCFLVGGRAPALAHTVSADSTVMVRCDYYYAPSGYCVGSLVVFARYEA